MGLCGSNKTVAPQYFDPLGPNAEGQHTGNGGPELRDQIFSYLPAMMAQGQTQAKQAATAAQQGARQYGGIGEYGNQVLRGGYLGGNRYLDNAVGSARAASNQAAQAGYGQARASLAGDQRRTRSQFTRSGQQFGTGLQQSQDAASAALNAQIVRSEAARQAQLASDETAARLANYQAERQYQQQAPAMISMAAEKPFQLLSAVPSVSASGLNPSAELVGALAGGGSVVNPGSYYKPGVFDYAMQGLGTAITGGWI